MFRRWQKLLLIGSILLAVVSGHRRDVAQRRGFHPQALEDMRARSLYGRDTPVAQRQYYTNATKSQSGAKFSSSYILARSDVSANDVGQNISWMHYRTFQKAS